MEGAARRGPLPRYRFRLVAALSPAIELALARDEEQARDPAVLLFDECKCGERADPAAADASSSSAAAASTQVVQTPPIRR